MSTPKTARTVVLCKWQPQLITALLTLTTDLYLVLDDYDVEVHRPDADVLARMRQVYRVSHFDSIEELAAVAVDLRLRGAEGAKVISHAELSQYGAGYLDLMLGSVQDPMHHVAFRDKRLMKQRVAGAGARAAHFQSVPDASDTHAVEQAAARLAFPVVVKPASGFGTMSTVRVDLPDALPAVVEELTFEPLLRSKQLIVEEFVQGTELCVDALWADGEALTFIVHQYYANRIRLADRGAPERPLDGSQILPEEHHPVLHRRLRELHDRVNQGLGIRDGATHLEAFVQPDGDVVFSEIGTRIGGAWVPRMISAHLGYPVWTAIAEAELTGTCQDPKPPHPYVGAVHLSPERPGIITSMPEDEELAELPGVLDWQRLRKVGGKARLGHPSDWYLFVVLGAETQEEYDRLCHEVADRFRIETEPEPGGTDAPVAAGR
ncbi:ATP-grasp domain-containing protein [Streptomyces griseorubiginosus]|uniref:ATP-grasp domain-containing protein n=1 Tax=Streptomyces griseorubiginosus TaxID=67304 RepID=UPI002E824381|nr:ATP-grasp domain-containing protein [Streptomyces griseorubiginosus]WUB45526.1 ATP-grasp domain-containing protein [Streptomyces griseorubiginosus]WUB54044.1 ATP-grasp domain-containing protein [Streptomyces griseorubiginosus]